MCKCGSTSEEYRYICKDISPCPAVTVNISRPASIRMRRTNQYNYY
jgi:hypothetical protein